LALSVLRENETLARVKRLLFWDSASLRRNSS